MYKNEEMKILVIIPAYNEEKNIKETVERLKESAASVDYVVIMIVPKTGRKEF